MTILHEKLEAVDGPDTFLAFVRELIADREGETGQPTDLCGRGVNGWENHTIEDFLEAAMAWAEASDFGEQQDLRDASPWEKFATFLWCGKIYE
ncbi:MAG: hypothetical protein NXI22_07895 [bacterium]|nr:hypothetical protein [bacterium]